LRDLLSLPGAGLVFFQLLEVLKSPHPAHADHERGERTRPEMVYDGPRALAPMAERISQVEFRSCAETSGKDEPTTLHTLDRDNGKVDPAKGQKRQRSCFTATREIVFAF
jgi:hypothetical protein